LATALFWVRCRRRGSDPEAHLNFRLPIKEKICPVPSCLPKVLLGMV